MSTVNALTPQSILIVEDEYLLRMAAAAMFEGAGFRVVEAETGEEGVAALTEACPIAGVFTDIDLPGGTIDGLSLAATVRERHPDAPILVASGRKSPSIRELPSEALFFAKPYDLGRIVLAMNAMLERPVSH